MRARTCWPSRTWPGCCGRRRRRTLVGALRSRFDLPVHVHTHDTPGGQLATYVAAWQAGASAVDGAAAPMAGHHQPARAELDRRRGCAHRRTTPGCRWRGVRPGAVLGGAAKGVRAVRIWASRPDGPGVSPRDSRRPAVEPAPAGDRAGAGRPVRGRSRTPMPAPTGCWAGWSRSRRRRRWSATWRSPWSAPG